MDRQGNSLPRIITVADPNESVVLCRKDYRKAAFDVAVSYVRQLGRRPQLLPLAAASSP